MQKFLSVIRSLSAALLLPFLMVLFLSCEEPDSDETTKVNLKVVQSSITHTSVDLIWTKPDIPNFKEYEIRFDTVQNFRITLFNLYETIDDKDETSTTVTGLRPNRSYYFRVHVITTDDRILKSNEVSAVTSSPPPEAQIRFIHTATALPSLLVKVDRNAIDTLSFGGFTSYSLYKAGRRSISLWNNAILLDSGTVKFDTLEKATVFILDKQRSTSPRFAVLYERDIYDRPTSPFAALLRFVNTSIGLDTASLKVRGGTFIGSKVLFGKASSYTPWSGDSLTLILTRYRDTTALLPPIAHKFLVNKRYTIVALDSVHSVKLKTYIDD